MTLVKDTTLIKSVHFAVQNVLQQIFDWSAKFSLTNEDAVRRCYLWRMIAIAIVRPPGDETNAEKSKKTRDPGIWMGYA